MWGWGGNLGPKGHPKSIKIGSQNDAFLYIHVFGGFGIFQRETGAKLGPSNLSCAQPVIPHACPRGKRTQLGFVRCPTFDAAYEIGGKRKIEGNLKKKFGVTRRAPRGWRIWTSIFSVTPLEDFCLQGRYLELCYIRKVAGNKYKARRCTDP